MKANRLGVALACGLSLAASTAHADFRGAMQAYAAGKYAQAHAQFLALAELGDGASQYDLGAMAIHGQGEPKDIATGIGWLLAAATNDYHPLTAEQMASLKASLTAAQRTVADGVLGRYGHAALAATVLPPEKPTPCPGVVPGMLVQDMPAEYPVRYGMADHDGIVMLGLTIGVDGLARDPEVLMKAPSDSDFSASAIGAALQSRWVPTTRDGVPIESRIRILRVFTIVRGGVLWNARALKQVLREADAGDPDAQYVAGLAATLDTTVGIPLARAHQLLLSAAQGGQPRAQYLIARSFGELAICARDAKREAIWLRAAAASGDASAQLAVASDLLRGTPSAGEIAQARSLLEQAARSDRYYVAKHVVMLMAASPVEGLRDPVTALSVAKRLARGAIRSDPQMYEAVAAARAANGDFPAAVAEQKKAIAMAQALYWNTSLMEQRLAAYRRSQPWLGDLLSVPPAIVPPPALKHPARICNGDATHCRDVIRRQSPDREPEYAAPPTGSNIPR